MSRTRQRSIVYRSSIVEDSDVSMCWKYCHGQPQTFGCQVVSATWRSSRHLFRCADCGSRMLNVLADPGIHSWRLLLLAALLLGTLTLTLGIDLSSERAKDSQFSSRNASKRSTYSSQPRANQYITKTWAVKRIPATLPW